MKRMSLPSFVIAISLALLLPIELAHCVWMGVPQQGVRGAAATSVAHACCRVAARTHSAPPASSTMPGTCTCIQLPFVTLPSPVVVDTPTIEVGNCSATVHEPLLAPSPRIATVLDPAPVFGSPPHGGESHAHGLRAPPGLA